MNPVKIGILYTHDFDFHGFYDMIEGLSMVLCHSEFKRPGRRRSSVENIVEIGENAGNQHFLLWVFPKCFLSFQR